MTKDNNKPWRLTWRPDLSVGIDAIDAEHQTFIGLINDFNDALRDRAPIDTLSHHLDLILEDAKAHFAHEEQLFELNEYDEWENHQKEHQRLLVVMDGLRDQFKHGANEFVMIEAGITLRDALVDHLLAYDMRYCGKLPQQN